MARSQATPFQREDLSRQSPLALNDDDDADPNHHLWRNGRLWWVAFTVHLPGWQKDRVRLSLGTADLGEARRRRDQLLQEYPLLRGCELSLRLNGRKAGRARAGRSGMRQPTVAA